MKQVYVQEPLKLTIFDAPQPEVHDPKGIVVKVQATGICATDVHTFLGETIHGKCYPFHIGHEIAGKVIAIGAEVDSVSAGDSVVVNPLIYCGTCSECISQHWNFCKNVKALGLTGPGGFSDYVYTIEQNVSKYFKKSPQEMSFAEPLATVLHALDLLQPIQQAASYLIQGAGTLGLLFLKALQQKVPGIDVIVSDPNVGRHTLIEQNHAKAVIPENLVGSFDIIIDCTGNVTAVQTATQKLNNHGTLLQFGVCPQNSKIEIDPFLLYRRELSFIGAYALNNNITEAAELIDNGEIEVKDLISGVIPREVLKETLEGLANRVLNGKYIVTIEG